MSRVCPFCNHDSGFDVAVCPNCGRGGGSAGAVAGTRPMDVAERTVLESPRRGAPDHTVLQNDPTIISSRHDERACFFVKAGPEVGKQFMLGEVSLLGRGRDCQVRLTDVRVGSRHAQVKLVSGHFTYQDLQSANGSFLIVGGRRERLRTDHVLADDDEIVVGDTTLKFMAVGGGRR